jgi:hypothetical protein
MPGKDDAELIEQLTVILRGAPSLMRVLAIARALDLPDSLIMSGAVYQRVLNKLTMRAPDYGVRDYDLAYFDASDISYEAEDAIIRRVAAAFDGPLRSAVEVRNQARVHVWFEGHFGEPYTPYRARLKRWSALPRRCSRSECGWVTTIGCMLRLRSASPTCSRCGCGPTRSARQLALTGLLLVSRAAGRRLELRVAARDGIRPLPSESRSACPNEFAAENHE